MAAGVAAGLGAWLGGEACLDLIKPHRQPVNSRGIILSVIQPREQGIADAKNAGLSFALLGAIFGGCLGAAGGLTRRSGRAATSAAILGLATGAIACAAGSMALLPLYDAYRNGHPDEASKDLIFPLIVHAGVWSATGASGGAAFAFGLGTRGVLARSMMGGLLGAIIAAATYELIGVIAFPMSGTTQFVSSTWPTRLMARLAVGSMAAAGIALADAIARRRSATVAPKA